MDDKIVATFCLCDDLVKAMHHQEDSQRPMNDAEIMTTALSAALCFRGNHASARAMLTQYGSLPQRLSQRRLSRRLHHMKALFIILCNFLAQLGNTLHTASVYVIARVPGAVCDHRRIRRAKIDSHEEFRGYQARKKRSFYGLKLPLMGPQDGQPVACVLTPGHCSDVEALQSYAYELPDGATIYADKAYNDYEIAELLKESEPVHLLPIRKKNSQRALSPAVTFVQSSHRKRVETAGSLSEQL